MSSSRTSDPAQTEALAARLAARLQPGDVVLVRGELGAGKTTFVRGAARALGVREPVTSPTFTLANRYAAGAAPVSHLDLYRLAAAADEEPGLVGDYIDGDSIAFVEWPVDDAPELQAPRATVTISHVGGDEREIRVEERE
jgi:tRNA threonylcarbamoyladenosine biosynthesis protein TsaE